MTLTPDRAAPGRDSDAPAIDPTVGLSSPLLEIANTIVRVYKATFGRGPTQARARFAGPDTLVVLLQDTMTVAERSLAAVGEHERVRANRLMLHSTIEGEMRGLVERILTRRTLAVISGIDVAHDVVAEVFLLAPLSDDGG